MILTMGPLEVTGLVGSIRLYIQMHIYYLHTIVDGLGVDTFHKTIVRYREKKSFRLLIF